MINKQIIDPFGIPVIQYDLECGEDLNKWLIDRAYTLDNYAEHNRDKIKGYHPKGTKFNENSESFIGAHTPPFNRSHMFPGFPEILVHNILDCVYDFSQHFGIELLPPESIMFYIERCWSTITKPHDKIDGHNHVTHTFSCAYYPDWEEAHGGIWFQRGKHPDAHVFFKEGAGANEQITVLPKTGSLIMFPSYIMHGTEQNNAGRDRISYSFDIGEIGSYYKLPPIALVEHMWKEFNNKLHDMKIMEALSK
jgi:uncharacterized protein (TIGR02466 family)